MMITPLFTDAILTNVARRCLDVGIIDTMIGGTKIKQTDDPCHMIRITYGNPST